jgi:hypothetical protein
LSATKLVLLRQIINTGFSLESNISIVVAHDPTKLSEFTKKRLTAAKVFNSEWTKLEGDRRQVFVCNDVVSEEGSTDVIYIDFGLGKFLVDGCLVGKLPEEIVSTQQYLSVFETANFQVQKDQTGVFTTSEIYGHIYSFCLCPDNYLVATSPVFTLNLDDMILTENATGRRLISCTSESCFLLIEILKRIDANNLSTFGLTNKMKWQSSWSDSDSNSGLKVTKLCLTNTLSIFNFIESKPTISWTSSVTGHFSFCKELQDKIVNYADQIKRIIKDSKEQTEQSDS